MDLLHLISTYFGPLLNILISLGLAAWGQFSPVTTNALIMAIITTKYCNHFQTENDIICVLTTLIPHLDKLVK